LVRTLVILSAQNRLADDTNHSKAQPEPARSSLLLPPTPTLAAGPQISTETTADVVMEDLVGGEAISSGSPLATKVNTRLLGSRKSLLRTK